MEPESTKNGAQPKSHTSRKKQSTLILMKKLILTTLAGFVASFIFGSISYFLYYEKLMVALMEKYPASIKTEPDLMI